MLKAFASSSRYYPGILLHVEELQSISHPRVPCYIANAPISSRRLSVIVRFHPLDPIGLETAIASLSNQMPHDHHHTRLNLFSYPSIASFSTSLLCFLVLLTAWASLDVLFELLVSLRGLTEAPSYEDQIQTLSRLSEPQMVEWQQNCLLMDNDFKPVKDGQWLQQLVTRKTCNVIINGRVLNPESASISKDYELLETHDLRVRSKTVGDIILPPHQDISQDVSMVNDAIARAYSEFEIYARTKRVYLTETIGFLESEYSFLNHPSDSPLHVVAIIDLLLASTMVSSYLLQLFKERFEADIKVCFTIPLLVSDFPLKTIFRFAVPLETHAIFSKMSRKNILMTKLMMPQHCHVSALSAMDDLDNIQLSDEVMGGRKVVYYHFSVSTASSFGSVLL